MKRWLMAVTTIALMALTPMATADRDHDRGKQWHKEHDRSDGRMKMRVRDPHAYHDRHYHRDNRGHHGRYKKHRWHHDHDRRDRRYRHDYRGHHRYDRHRHRSGIIIGIGGDRPGLVIRHR